MRDVVVFREPKLKPLPLAVQDKMKDALLPQRILDAERAVAKCYDLSELSRMKDQALAIATAAKIAKRPEMVKGWNKVCKEALLQIGKILLQYSKGGTRSEGKGERASMAAAAGLDHVTSYASARLASAPRAVQRGVIENERISPSPSVLMRKLPRAGNCGAKRKTEAFQVVMLGIVAETGARSGAAGLSKAKTVIAGVDLALVRSLAPDEKKLVKAKVAEIMELLDAIDAACGK